IPHRHPTSKYPPSSSNYPVKLPHFIAYALHRTKLRAHPTSKYPPIIIQLRPCEYALYPPSSSNSQIYPTVIFMLASKVICDDTYSNKS
ncbi:uncharacterized protein EDB91DRAFT_1064875, partial [Suillus paluster]|uniref:uncharacterized protein n=1 Tax=Suillus paluster TaxID=48578 RepID=UPI001B87774E